MKTVLITALLLALSVPAFAGHNGGYQGAAGGTSQSASGSTSVAYTGVAGNGAAGSFQEATTTGLAFVGARVDPKGQNVNTGAQTSVTSQSLGYQFGSALGVGHSYSGSSASAAGAGGFVTWGSFGNQGHGHGED